MRPTASVLTSQQWCVVIMTPSVTIDFAVAYVKFDRASAAATAIEVMNGAVLNGGRGPKLKVFLAEALSSRYARPVNGCAVGCRGVQGIP